MTPQQMLARVEKAPPEPVVEAEVVSSEIVVQLGEGIHYTSDAMEEDFSTSVELLMNTPGFLRILAAIDDAHDFLTPQHRATLNEHLEAVQDFIGQWMND